MSKLAQYWKTAIVVVGMIVTLGAALLPTLKDSPDWVPVALGTLTAFLVWLKANAPAPPPAA